MLILLPPSEGKTAPAAGPPVTLASLTHPRLAALRQRVGDTLARVSGQKNALEILGTGPSLAAEVERNRTIWDNPTAPAAQVYSGVLYDAAGMAHWDGATLALAHQRIRIVSALWGALSPADRIPAYRLSMGTHLGRIGPLGPWWRAHLGPELDALAQDSLVIDCRSAAYGAAYRPRSPGWVTVSVQRDLGGRRAVVSHMAKHTRGLLAGHLIAADAVPESAADLADAAATLLGATLVDATVTPRGTGRAELTLVLRG